MRYRGYYYDTETGFYYLQSRYYDPEICRFINADSYASTGQGYMGYNMFAYCQNNPIAFADYNGEWINIVIGAVVGFAAGAISAAVTGGSWADKESVRLLAALPEQLWQEQEIHISGKLLHLQLMALQHLLIVIILTI